MKADSNLVRARNKRKLIVFRTLLGPIRVVANVSVRLAVRIVRMFFHEVTAGEYLNDLLNIVIRDQFSH